MKSFCPFTSRQEARAGEVLGLWGWLSIGLFFVLIGGPRQALAAACCVGGGGSSQLMTELNQAEFRLSTSLSMVVAEKFASPRVLFWDGQRSQSTWTSTPSLGYRFAEDWQIGVSLDQVVKSNEFEGGGQDRSARLGDSRLLVAYEWLHPTPSFDPWPQLFVSLELLLPTGRGLEESKTLGLTDVTGMGQAGSALGLHAFKRLGQWRLSGDLRHSLFYPRSVTDVRLLSREQWTWSLGILRTEPWAQWSYGLLLASTHRQGRRLESDSRGFIEAPAELFYEFTAYLLWSLTEQWNLNFSYSDQTILGPVRNTNLSRRFGVMLTHVWPQ